MFYLGRLHFHIPLFEMKTRKDIPWIEFRTNNNHLQIWRVLILVPGCH